MNIQELECLFYVCFERALNTPTCFAVLNDVDNAMKYDVRGNDCAGKP